MKEAFDIKMVFNDYAQVMSMVATDVSFWKSFVTMSIKNYQARNVQPHEIYGSILTTYDIDIATNSGYLVTSNKATSVLTTHLEKHRRTFFSWVLNLSILKSYNALEVFLLRAIWLNYFPNLGDPTSRKKALDDLQNEIRKALNKSGLSVDTKNNRHIIAFLKTRSEGFKAFVQLPLRLNLNTSREDFFEMMSVLRNIIAHQGTIITQDTLNGLKAKARDIFEQHFAIDVDANGLRHLSPLEVGITTLFDLITEFGANGVKFAYGKKDLKFIGMTELAYPQ